MPKRKSTYVDFRAVRAAITMEQVLEHYGLLDKFKRSGDNLTGPCPIHKGKNPTQFRVSLGKNVFNCFSECQNGGNALDFIARMEDVSVKDAALKAIEWFNLDTDEVFADSSSSDDRQEPETKPAIRPKAAAKAPAENDAPNAPLQFRLDKLHKSHPYLTERGLTQETIIQFGVGFCEKGMMAGRIAIPIFTPKGEVVAYAGRWPGEPEGDTPKYKLPPGFRKSLELYNIDQAIKEPKESPLIIVEGFFDCIKLWQLGVRRVVALMGSTMSIQQEALIRKLTNARCQIIVMLDEDEAGQAGRKDIAARLVRSAFVKVHSFEKEGMQPEHLTAEEIQQIVGGVI